MKHVETKTALLTSAGYNYRKWTWHSYAFSTPDTLENGMTGLAHIFRCEETGELRRWGFDTTFEAN